MHQKKVINKTSLTNMSKSEKSAFFRHVFANNFFLVHFSKLFQRIRNQREILRFFTYFSIFSNKKFFLGHISTFFELWLQMRRKRLKKTENLFLWMYLRISLCNHQRVCITKLLKSLYPSVHIHYEGKWEGVGPWNSPSFLGPVKWYRANRRVPFGAQCTGLYKS